MSKVTEFLREQDRIIAEDREATLISLGLFEKEYAPDGKISRHYQKYDIVNGEKRYYREVAVSVSEEEWQMIMEKTKTVSEIRLRKEEEEKKARDAMERKHGVRTEHILPNFPREEAEESVYEDKPGRSKIATALRIAAVVMAIYMVISGMVAWAGGYVDMIFTYIGAAVLSFILLCALAEILNYLAVLTAIAKGGYHITKK